MRDDQLVDLETAADRLAVLAAISVDQNVIGEMLAGLQAVASAVIQKATGGTVDAVAEVGKDEIGNLWNGRLGSQG